MGATGHPARRRQAIPARAGPRLFARAGGCAGSGFPDAAEFPRDHEIQPGRGLRARHRPSRGPVARRGAFRAALAAARTRAYAGGTLRAAAAPGRARLRRGRARRPARGQNSQRAAPLPIVGRRGARRVRYGDGPGAAAQPIGHLQVDVFWLYCGPVGATRRHRELRHRQVIMGLRKICRICVVAAAAGITLALLSPVQAQFWDSWGNRPQRQQQQQWNNNWGGWGGGGGGWVDRRNDERRYYDPYRQEREAAVDYSRAPAEAAEHANMTPEQARQASYGPWEFHTEKWELAYVRRIDAMIAALKSAGVPVLWVGLSSQRNTKPSADSSYLNELYRSRAEKAGIIYVDIWDGFVDEGGRYSAQGPDYEGQIRRLRSGDGVYFSKFGARKLAHYVEREIHRSITNRGVPVALPVPTDSGAQAPNAKTDAPAH